MPGKDDGLGKQAEQKIKEWLDRPEEGYCFHRLPDQLTGFYGSSNICDFICFKSPNMYYIESKATWADRFDFSMISGNQREGLLEKSHIDNVNGWVIVLFQEYKRCFIFDIQDICNLRENGTKSLNIKKIDKWPIKYAEIQTIPNNRKNLLDYAGEIETYLNMLKGDNINEKSNS